MLSLLPLRQRESLADFSKMVPDFKKVVPDLVTKHTAFVNSKCRMRRFHYVEEFVVALSIFNIFPLKAADMLRKR